MVWQIVWETIPSQPICRTFCQTIAILLPYFFRTIAALLAALVPYYSRTILFRAGIYKKLIFLKSWLWNSIDCTMMVLIGLRIFTKVNLNTNYAGLVANYLKDVHKCLCGVSFQKNGREIFISCDRWYRCIYGLLFISYLHLIYKMDWNGNEILFCSIVPTKE